MTKRKKSKNKRGGMFFSQGGDTFKRNELKKWIDDAIISEINHPYEGHSLPLQTPIFENLQGKMNQRRNKSPCEKNVQLRAKPLSPKVPDMWSQFNDAKVLLHPKMDNVGLDNYPHNNDGGAGGSLSQLAEMLGEGPWARPQKLLELGECPPCPKYKKEKSKKKKKKLSKKKKGKKSN